MELEQARAVSKTAILPKMTIFFVGVDHSGVVEQWISHSCLQ